MGEIKSREENPVPGIAYSEIHIPDEDSLGTGVFTSVLHPGAFGKNNPIISSIMNEPFFVLILSMNIAIESVTAMIGKSQNARPLDRKVFKIPSDVDVKKPLSFKITFNDWDLLNMELNGTKMETAE
ncbi:MAG: hypothetical protein JSV11_06840 [Nitrospiraceae bacterium]|nr:MAG: hypothetical protein JSV11_06840 [Nitrospiraceae bacterium]